LIGDHVTRRLQLSTGAVVFTASLTIAILRVTTLSEVAGVRLRMPWTMNDFKTAIYCPVSIFLHGGNPYDRAQFLRFCPVQDVFPLYLPWTLIMHAPLGALPIHVATLLYFALTVGLSLLVVLFGLRLAGARASVGAVLLGTGLLLLSRPGQWNLLLGQPSLELVLATFLAIYGARRAPWLSGLALAVSMYKPTFGVPLAFLMLVRGDTRAVVAGVLLTAVLNAVPLAVLMQRAGGPEPFLHNLIQSQHAWATVVDPATQVYGVDAPAFLSRVLGRRLTMWEYAAVAALVLAAASTALHSLKGVTEAMGDNLSATIICLGILLSVHHQTYDLVLLVAPVIALARSALPASFLVGQRGPILRICVSLLAVNYITTRSLLERLRNDRVPWLLLASLNGALLLTIFLIYVTPLIHRASVRRSVTASSFSVL
jgi:glycosyl transferase family 87